MTVHQCPHCHTNVPNGATVCTGCQAEVEYGAPRFAVGVVAVASGLLGIQSATWTSINLVGWIVGLLALVAGGTLIAKLFAGRVVFRRYYRR